MTEALIIVSITLLVAVIVMLAFVLRREAATDLSSVISRIETMEKAQERTERSVKEEFARNRQESNEQGRGLREEVQGSLKSSTDSLVNSVDMISKAQRGRLEDFATQLNALKLAGETSASNLRLELTNALNTVKESQDSRLSANATQLQQHFNDFAAQLAGLTEKNEKKSDELRDTVESKLADLQSDNAAKLEEMRRTVDEKLQGTLDQRLGESFKQVSDRLEQVHQGLGAMQNLATGVGDLKRVLTNVKTRGTWGEMQLGNLLDQVLTIDQYARDVRTNPASGQRVEFAVKLPGPEDRRESVVWLPIDAKFPKEDYERLVEASERSDIDGVEQAGKDLESAVRSQARDIRTKYISPPYTTDFGLLYLPTEGLYAEVLRRPGLMDALQREQRVVIVGPTTLAALLNSLQMGFQTLAIQKKSSEVWRVLSEVKTQFGIFGGLLDKVKKKLEETGNTIDDAVHRTRQIEKKLRKAEAFPTNDGPTLFPQPDQPQLADVDDDEPAESLE